MRLFPEDQDDNALMFGAILILLSLGCFAFNYLPFTTDDGQFAILYWACRLRLIFEFFPMGLILFPCILFVLTLFYLVYEITISGIALFVLNVVSIIIAIKAYPMILVSIKLWG